MNLGRKSLWLAALSIVAVVSFLTGLIISARLGTRVPSTAEAVQPPLPRWTAAPDPAGLSEDDVVLTQDLFRRIAQSVSAGVVKVQTTTFVSRRRWFDDMFRGMPEWFRFHFQEPGDEGPQGREPSWGSGFFIDSTGLILTNLHVIESREEGKIADDIRVILHNGHSYKAEVVGFDRRLDVALLRIKPDEPVTALSLGDSNKVQVGDWVIAVGNPFNFSNSVTAGIISGRGGTERRPTRYVDFIQTDAPINPGNSGGPLVNLRGEVIGINNWIFTNSFQWAGLGFAIPINPVKQVLPQLKEKGHVDRGYLGVVIQFGESQAQIRKSLGAPYGAPVIDVDKGTPADEIGIRRYDVIMEVNDQKVERAEDLSDIISSYPPGTKVKLKVWRDGKPIELTATLARLPEETTSRPAREERRKQTLGLELEPITPSMAERMGLSVDHGLLVRRVAPQSPAYEAGLTEGDVIAEVDRKPVQSVDEFIDLVEKARKANRDSVILLVFRGRAAQPLLMTLPLPKP
ncbi:MAG: trypsin-like peptidase domain-containing protein [Acidobacteria bacterium]|nr:trypsin-like peptidase domain-containing protein [Acidobacteriota bacterium]MDW7983639.1 trypsin-like peptidase domain-containing protein [Acidobacteriota bacterium]